METQPANNDRPMDLVAFATDASLEMQGVWMAWQGGAEFNVVSADQPHVQALRETLQAPYKSLIRKNKLPGDVADDITVKVLSRAVVTNWRTRRNKDETIPTILFQGQHLQFTPDNAARVFTVLKELRLDLTEFALMPEAFRVAEVEEGVKNS